MASASVPEKPRAGLANGAVIVHAIGATILLSIVAHSSTDIPVVRWYNRVRERAGDGGMASQPARP